MFKCTAKDPVYIPFYPVNVVHAEDNKSILIPDISNGCAIRKVALCGESNSDQLICISAWALAD